MMAEPGLGGLHDAPRRFAGPALREPPHDPIARPNAVALYLSGDRFLRKVEERGQRLGLRHRRRRIPLRDRKHFRTALARERRIRQNGIARAEIDADTEFALRHLTMPSCAGKKGDSLFRPDLEFDLPTAVRFG